MHWIDWVVIALFALGALGGIAQIDRPRKPIDHGTAMIIVIIYAAMIAGILITHL